jgi:outer membrane protein W
MPFDTIKSNTESDYNGLGYNYKPFFLSSLYNNKDKSTINSLSAQQKVNDYYARIGVDYYKNGNYKEVTPNFSLGYNPSENSNVSFDYRASMYPSYNINYTTQF